MSSKTEDYITRDIEAQNDCEHEEREAERAQLDRIKSSGVLTISPELFEKLYIQPKSPAVGDFRQRFANPTPLGFMGFVISTATFSMVLMGWGGATTLTSVVGIFFFTGPVLLLLATIFEWVMGNFLPMMICGMFAVFWLSFGTLQLPTWQIAESYSASGTNAAEGAATVGYNAGIALYLIVWGFTLATFFVFTLKTNTVFALIFFCVDVGVWCLSAAYWKVASGDYDTAAKLQKTGGAFSFVVALLGWYITVVMICAELRITVKLPVGDLSHFWPDSDKTMAEMERETKDQ